MKKYLVLSFLGVALTGFIATYSLYKGYIRFNYPDHDTFPIRGIDISHHQGIIRWDELKSENVSFVIIKATEGGDYKDPLFEQNWANSKKSGYKTGAYHFYRLCKNGKEQAENFIAAVPNQPDNLPPAIDLEFGGNCDTDKSHAQIQNEIQDFLTMLEDHYRKKPILYATREFYDEFVTAHFKAYPLWIRDIYRQPRLENGRYWSLWQFANRAHLNGIDTYVDLNVLNGRSYEMLSADQ